jgi:DNA-binding LacI/PurR family transcriptional regulator
VLGSLYADQQHLPSVDMDYRQAGYLLAKRLIERGHTRNALLTTGGGRPGDHALFDGISDAFTEAGLPHNALIVRIFPHDFETFRAQTRDLLDRPDRPTGIICGSDRLVHMTASTAADVGLEVPRDVELVFQGQAKPEAQQLPYPAVQPRLQFRQVAELIADMLARLAAGETLKDKRIVIPVELHDPAEAYSDRAGSTAAPVTSPSNGDAKRHHTSVVCS